MKSQPRKPRRLEHIFQSYDAPVYFITFSTFDHILRHGESYSEKWNYVHQNPLRAGLVEQPEDWPFQGEVVPIRY